MELSVFSDERYMQEALKEAEIAFEEGEIPVGAVVVCKNRIIARAHNQTERLTDVTAHAEMLAITAASNYLGGKFLNECSLYVTLEPCTMCAGALFWSQIGKVVIGASDEKRGYRRFGSSVLHPKTNVVYDVHAAESQVLLAQFFARLRE